MFWAADSNNSQVFMTPIKFHAASKSSAAKKPSKSLGPLPEWNLADLYPAMDAPEVKRDLDRGETECIEFEKAYKGRLADIAASPDAGRTLGEAVRRYEAIEDVLGRLISYAGLLYAGNTTDPAIAKFYGDMQERITAASLHLLFFTLDLNRLDDAALDKAMADPALGHYRPWIEDLRKDKPYQLEDRVEQLFHEKSVTGYSAFNRLFDETMVALRFKVGGKSLPLEQTLNLMQDADPKKRKAAAEALAKTFKENLRLFTLVTNTLAKDKEISDRWRGFGDVAQSRHLANRVEPEVVDALVSSVREAYPRLSHRYYALKAHWFGKKQLPHWDRNAPLPQVAMRTIALAAGAADGAHRLRRVLAEDGGDRRALLQGPLDRCAGAARQIAGRLRASDRAVGASLCDAELPGQAARRDDARARARPRRASGAGGAERPADGADAADAWPRPRACSARC